MFNYVVATSQEEAEELADKGGYIRHTLIEAERHLEQVKANGSNFKLTHYGIYRVAKFRKVVDV